MQAVLNFLILNQRIMATWSKICDVLEKYANRKNEMTYQKSIIDLLLEMNLGWHKNQITEQLSIPTWIDKETHS